MRTSVLVIAALAVAGTASAQTSWSTNFSPPSNGSFSNLGLFNGATIGLGGDAGTEELQLFGLGFANLSFTVPSSTPSFALTFLAGRGVTDVTQLRVALSGPGVQVSGVTFVDVPLRAPGATLATRNLGLVASDGQAWAAGNYVLQFVSASNNSSVPAFRIDDVRVTAVPEPASYALFLGGMAAVALAARRRRTTAA